MLKNTYIIILLILLYTNKIYSQSVVAVGINAGVKQTNLIGPDKPISIEKGYGPTIGVFIDFKISSQTSLLFELNYLRKKFGFKEELFYGSSTGKISVTERNDFIQLPFQMRLKWGDNVAGTFINFGGMISVLILNSRDTAAFILDTAIPAEYYYKYKNNTFDYGLLCGAGIQYKSVSLEFRYSLNLRNLYVEDNAKEMRYNMLSLILSYNLSYIAPRGFRNNVWLRKIKSKFNIF